MGSSLGFGSSACDYGPCGPRPIQTRFRFGSGRQSLTSPHTANSPDHSSIGTPSRYCLRSNTLRLLVGTRFQFLFHSPPGVLFTFPSRYWFTIGGKECLALGGGPPGIPARFLVSRGTWDLKSKPIFFRLQGFHLLWRLFPEPSTIA